MYRDLAPVIGQAVETIKQASVLVDAYLECVKRFSVGKASSSNPLSGLDPSLIDHEDLLLSTDQNYAALWAKLDEARAQLRLGGLEAAEYDGIRARVGNAAQGYKEEHRDPSTAAIVAGALLGVEAHRQTHWWIEPGQVELPVQALAALKRLLPGVDWQVRLDADAEAFVRGERRGRWLWKAVIVAVFVIIGCGFALLLCRP